MFGVEELKKSIEITETTVECPVKGCSEKVERQRKIFKKENRFRCPEHSIFISPSTFEYSSEFDNLLWQKRPDKERLKRIRGEKRESRMARDNSEDAVTWNVFRFLEKNNLLSGLLTELSKSSVRNPELIYWSYCQSEQSVWSKLQRARKEFETRPRKGSEPDIIVKSDNALFFIEAKLKASNNTVFKSRNQKVQEKYESGGDNWFSEVFNSDFRTVAIVEKKYELLRFWLLGTWMAKQQDLDFYLINLVLSKREADIETLFKAHVNENQRRKFQRFTWESIYEYISRNPSEDQASMMRYFQNKTIGYDGNGRLQRVFTII